MFKRIIDWLARRCERRSEGVQFITGTDPSDVYMVRYILLKTSWVSIYIHQFLRSDRDSYHDHPWNFWTYIVSGKYIEHRPWYATRARDWNQYHSGGKRDVTCERGVDKNRFSYRDAECLHWVEIDQTYRFEDRYSAPTTICITGPKWREWGFIDPKIDGWIHWKEYLGVTD